MIDQERLHEIRESLASNLGCDDNDAEWMLDTIAELERNYNSLRQLAENRELALNTWEARANELERELAVAEEALRKVLTLSLKIGENNGEVPNDVILANNEIDELVRTILFPESTEALKRLEEKDRP